MSIIQYYLVSGELVGKNITMCSYIIDSCFFFNSLSTIFFEFLLKTFNNNSAFFNLIVDVAETSGCTYVLAYFFIDQINLTSAMHDNMSFFSNKINITNLSTSTTLNKFVYLNSYKWLTTNP